MRNFHLSQLTAISLALLGLAKAQDLGTDICICSPSTYTFQFDFALFCPPVNVTRNDVVTETSCDVQPYFVESVRDLVPVSISNVQVLELDQNLRTQSVRNFARNFDDGDFFQYIAPIVDPASIPRAIQMNIIGANQFDEPIINRWSVEFSNVCGTYPVLLHGQSIGWVRFRNLGEARQEFCPFSPRVPTALPTSGPSIVPSLVPSSNPSPSPSLVPTLIPSAEPSTPTTLPTMSRNPSSSPSATPSASPSDTPTPPATPAPSPSSLAPSNSPTNCQEVCDVPCDDVVYTSRSGRRTSRTSRSNGGRELETTNNLRHVNSDDEFEDSTTRKLTTTGTGTECRLCEMICE